MTIHGRMGRQEGWIARGWDAAGILLVGSTLWAGYASIYQPLVAMKEAARDRSTQVTALLENAAVVHKKHRELRNEQERLEAIVAVARSQLAETDGDDGFEEALRRLAPASGLTDFHFQVRERAPQADLRETEITFQARGGFASISRFLFEADQLPWMTKISRLDIHSTGKSGDNTVQGSFILFYDVLSHDKDKKGDVL